MDTTAQGVGNTKNWPRRQMHHKFAVIDWQDGDHRLVQLESGGAHANDERLLVRSLPGFGGHFTGNGPDGGRAPSYGSTAAMQRNWSAGTNSAKRNRACCASPWQPLMGPFPRGGLKVRVVFDRSCGAGSLVVDRWRWPAALPWLWSGRAWPAGHPALTP